METTLAPEEGNKVRLHVAVSAAEFERDVESAFRSLASQLRIPGFRPGKAPRKVLEARIGPQAAREQALRDALPRYYAEAIEQHEVDAIAPPSIDVKAGAESGDVEFEAIVEVRPIIGLSGYRGLRIAMADPSVADEELDAEIDRLRDRFADLEESAHPLTEGDFAAIDVKGYIHDEVIDGLSASDFLYEVGSQLVTPKLDVELLGKRPGDIIKFNDVLGERFGEREGQEVSFQVLVKEVKRKVLPEATDEWASEASEFETVADLRAEIKHRLELLARVRAQMELRGRVLESLADLVDVDAPQSLVEAEMERRIHDLFHRLQSQGLSIPTYLQATGRDEQAFVAEIREGAVKAVKADLGVRAIVAQEHLTASDDEVEAEIERFATQAGIEPAEARERVDRGGGIEAVRSELARGKAMQLVVETAEVLDEEGNVIDISLPEPSSVAEVVAEQGHDHADDEHDEHEHDEDHDAEPTAAGDKGVDA